MNLNAYLARIGVRGPVKPDIDGLRRVHRAHALSLTYENLDVQLGAPSDRSAANAFDKIVNRRRGGWCYEMNGLLGWALDEIGFRVTRLAGAVMREKSGDDVIGNHLVLLVEIDDARFICDVGFGSGPIDPFAMREGPISIGAFNYRLSDLGSGWWRFTEDERMGAMSYDFNRAVDDEAMLERQCRFLQTDPSSPFMQNAVLQRWAEDTHYSMRGRVLRILSPRGENKSLIETADEYARAVRDVFGVECPDAQKLWPAIMRRHLEIFESASAF
ncbi:MAG: arylamine N-acetyltransferase [Parvularculaceae bacterium]|nr:arylamine N-acetyltransferase [Parvularculaceae bacterium]